MPGITLADLIEQTAEFARPDDIYLMIAAGLVYVDLYAEPLAEPAKVCVFQDRDAVIHHRGLSGDQPAGQSFVMPLEKFRPGATLTWDNHIWQVVNVRNSMISLLGKDGSLVELPHTAVESLVRNGRVFQSGADRLENQSLCDQLLRSSEDDLKVANHRADIVRQHLSGYPPLDGQRISARTLRRWISQYRAAESQWGRGYIGLLPQIRKCGNSIRRLPDQSLQLMNEIIESEYESVKKKSRIACWAILKESCQRQSFQLRATRVSVWPCVTATNSTKP